MAKPSANDPSDLERGITTWADKGLAKYLEDSDLAKELVDWLYEETKLSKPLIRLAVKILATLVSTVARKGGSWLGKIAAQRLETALESLPFHEKFTAALDKLAANLDRELAGKQEVKDILAGRRPPHDTEYAKTLTLDLQTQIKQLQGLDELSNQVAEGFLNIEGLLNPQPPLHMRMITETSENRFFFGAQKVPFVGRGEEISEVTGFLHADGDFLWWLVAGPGGLGKSRLALEVCLRHGFAWRAGFFSPGDPFDDWGHWQPEQPTLLVADYASTRPKDLRGMVLALAQRNDLQFPVRVLLLERDAEGPWYSDFTGAGGDRHIIVDASHGPAKVLAPLGDDALWAILRSFLEGSTVTQPDREETLAALKQIDPGARPLFASFLGDSLADGRDPRDWDRQRLIVDVLDREKEKQWNPAGVTEKDMHLLALATMTEGIDLEHLSGIEAADLISDESGFSPERYQVMSGRPATETLAALEPDILGELFVLEQLKPAHRADTKRAETLRTAAWNQSPLGMGAFLNRATMDFPDHETLRLLHEVADGDEVQRTVWSMVAVNLIYYYGKAGDMASARALHDAHEKLAAKHPGEPALRKRQAEGAFNLMIGYGNAGDIAPARALYDALEKLAAKHPGEPALREQQAMGAVNLIAGYGDAGDIAPARALYDALEKLAAKHPGEPALRERQAKGAVNLIVGFGNAKDIAPARTLYDALEKLAAGHPGEPALREEKAKGAVNLIAYYGNAKDIAPAHALYDDLEKLATKHPGEPALRELQAEGALSPIVLYGNAGDIASARVLYDVLDKLAAKHPGELALRDSQARGAVNLIAYYSDAKDIAPACALYDDLEKLATKHPGEPALREEQAKGAFNLLAYYIEAKDIVPARALHDDLEKLATKHPGEPALRVPQARSAYNLIVLYGNAGEFASARALYDALEKLAARYPGEPVLRERQGKGAFSLIADYGNAGDIAPARAFYDALEKLAAKHPGEAEVREPQARGAALLLNSYKQNGDESAYRRFEKKVESDPELEALVRALLETMTQTDDGDDGKGNG